MKITIIASASTKCVAVIVREVMYAPRVIMQKRMRVTSK